MILANQLWFIHLYVSKKCNGVESQRVVDLVQIRRILNIDLGVLNFLWTNYNSAFRS